MRHPAFVVRAFRAICATEHGNWTAVSASAHARVLWGYEPVSARILAVAGEFAASDKRYGSPIDEVVEMARGWFVRLIQEGRFDSVDTLLWKAGSAVRQMLAEAMDWKFEDRGPVGEPSAGSRGFSKLLRKTGLSRNACDDEISRKSGLPIDKVRQLRFADRLARRTRSEFRTIQRTEGGEFKRIERKRRRWLDGRGSDGGWAEG